MTIIGPYPEDIDPKHFLFKWIGNTQIQHIYQSILKELNGNHKYLRCTGILYENSEVLHTSI